MGCTVEACYRAVAVASGLRVVREERQHQGATLVAESHMTFAVG